MRAPRLQRRRFQRIVKIYSIFVVISLFFVAVSDDNESSFQQIFMSRDNRLRQNRRISMITIQLTLILLCLCCSSCLSTGVRVKTGAKDVFSSREKKLVRNGTTNMAMRVFLISDREDEKVLRTVSIPVTRFDDEELRVLVARMLSTVRQARGNGLAAPQVGINRRIMVVQRVDLRGDRRKQPYEVCFNPMILQQSTGTLTQIEACLSMPGYSGPVDRSTSIDVRFTDARGQVITHTFSGEMALVFLHELDHLDGIMYTDRMKDKSLLKQCLPWEYSKKSSNVTVSGSDQARQQ